METVTYPLEVEITPSTLDLIALTYALMLKLFSVASKTCRVQNVSFYYRLVAL